jgi:hypothetical protein
LLFEKKTWLRCVAHSAVFLPFVKCASLARAPQAMPAGPPIWILPFPRRKRLPPNGTHLCDALENAPLIYELDLVRPERNTNEKLKEKIEREGIPIYPGEDG